MSEDREPTQTTAAGETIPVPTRDDVMSALRKAAKVAAPHPGENREEASADRDD